MNPLFRTFLLTGAILLSFGAQSQVITELQKISASDREANENFAFSLDISGDYAIVGAPNEGTLTGKIKSKEGAAYIYQRQPDGTWKEIQKLVSDTRGPEDSFGKSVAISGKYIFVGSSGHRYDENGKSEARWAGAAYIFEKDNNGKWNQIQKLVGSHQGSAGFGTSISVHQNYLVISAPNEKIDATSQHPGYSGGAVYIYKKDNSGKWQLEKRVYASDKKNNTYFGKAISIQGTILAVGAYWETHDSKNENNLKAAGAVYIYKRTVSGDWVEIQKIVPSDRASADFFGHALNMNGKNLGVGAYRKAVNGQVSTGAAYIFRLQTDSTFKEMQKLEASDQGKQDSFGCAIEIDGDFAIISACGDYDDVNGKNSLLEAGSSYLFIQDECGVWRQVQKFTAKIRGYSADFGISLAMDGKNVLIGAINEELDFSQQNKTHAAGAAYFFEITGQGTNPCGDASVSNEIIDVDVVIDEKPDNGVSISVKDCQIILTAKHKNAQYQWVNCDKANQFIPNANQQEFKPNSNGYYAVMITKNNISILSDCYEIKISDNPKEEDTGENSFQINPNPNHGIFQIEVSGKIKEAIPVEISSALGRPIQQLKLTQASTKVDLGKIKPGVYVVKIKTPEETKKILLYIE